jgi:hypothetical protein
LFDTGVMTAALAALAPVMSVAATAGPAQSAQIILFAPNRIFLFPPVGKAFPHGAGSTLNCRPAPVDQI